MDEPRILQLNERVWLYFGDSPPMETRVLGMQGDLYLIETSRGVPVPVERCRLFARPEEWPELKAAIVKSAEYFGALEREGREESRP